MTVADGTAPVAPGAATPFAALIRWATLDRPRPVLLAVAVAIGIGWVLLLYDTDYLRGTGAYWSNPRGPWQVGSELIDHFDILDCLIGYQAFLTTPWHLPLFYVADLGAPAGTNIAFLDVVPVVAVAGRLASELAGQVLNPYGAWVGLEFVLSALFAALVVIEAGQRSLLAAAAASLLVLALPAFLYRVIGMALGAHFLLIGGLFLYLRDRRPGVRHSLALWTGWLALAFLVNIYIFAMTAGLYAASLAQRYRPEGLTGRAALGQAAALLGVLALLALLGGYFGPGTGSSPSAPGFGHNSMNLASPVWPQMSGVFPALDRIVDATGGQYEGYSYLGLGALLIILAGLLLNLAGLAGLLGRHRYLAGLFVALLLFAASDQVFIGHRQLLDLHPWRWLETPLGIFRSSGRMSWPVLYGLLLGGLVLVLRRLPPAPRVGFVALCCLLQVADSAALRHRLAVLQDHPVPPLLDPVAWQARAAAAARVALYPTFACAGRAQVDANLELQLAAVRARRPVNSVYNPRLREDCAALTGALLAGPWPDDTLYVIQTGINGNGAGVPPGWWPPGLRCQAFSDGTWCLGPAGSGGE